MRDVLMFHKVDTLLYQISASMAMTYDYETGKSEDTVPVLLL